MKNSLLILISILILNVSPLKADEMVQLSVKSEGDIASATGFIFSSTTNKQIKDLKISRKDSSTLLISFPFTDSERKSSSYASAMVVTKDGAINMSDIVSLKSEDPDNAFSDLPQCEENVAMPDLDYSQLGNLQTLVNIRLERREVLKTKISRILQGDTLKKLRSLEAGFGLSDVNPLSADLPPGELIDRLSRIALSIKAYEENKK